MDRRDALKKLGMGGVAVAGACLVISSPAFADGGSNTSRPGTATPTVTLAKGGGNDNASGTVSIPRLSCPGGTINPARLDYGISHTGTSLVSFTGDVTAYATAPTDLVTNPFQAAISLVWQATGTRAVTVTVAARWVCEEANSTNLAWSCGTWSFPFTANNGGVITAGTVTSTLGSCPAP